MRAIATKALRRLVYPLIERAPVRQSDHSREREAQKYWEDVNQQAFQSNSHWKGEKGLAEDVWFELGKPHVQLFRDHIRILGEPLPLKRIIEWGCGGGANAVHFGPLAEDFVGVDISKESLDQCKEALKSVGWNNFQAVLIDVAHPENAIGALIGTADVFLCTYVFELLPSQEYGQRILDVAYQVLKPGGFAIIQIKYETHERRTRSRKWGYRRNLANMTTYSIDGFWHRAEQAKFSPRSISLRPKDELVNDERYAYFILDKPAAVMER